MNYGGNTRMKPFIHKVQRQLRLMETLIQNRNWMKLHELAEN